MFKSRDLMIDLPAGAGRFGCQVTKDTNDDGTDECGPATKGDGGDTGVAETDLAMLRYQLHQALSV